MFNSEYMLDNPNIKFRMYNSDNRCTDKIKPSVDQICFKGNTYHFNDAGLYDANYSRIYDYGSKISAL